MWLLANRFFQGKVLLMMIRLAAIMGGFYVWQTNKVELAQDEGALYEFGIDLNHKNLSWKNEIGGYNGYDVYHVSLELQEVMIR
jgi:hypothetical protein